MRSSCKLIGLIATLVAPALVSAQTYPSATDPRSNLKPGRFDAGEAASNMRLVSFSQKPAQFDTARGLTFINSDLAFGTPLRLPGQLRRLHDMGREPIRQSRSSRRSWSASRRRATRRSSATCCSSPPRARAIAMTAARAACRTRRTTWRACASSTSRTRTRPS